MERYIAVDNVCAWPNLTLMPDGTIVATIFNQPTHGGWEGDVECWASTDQGRTWMLLSVPAPHEPATNRMNVAAGLAHDGDLIVLAAGWSRRLSPGNYSDPNEGDILPIWICRSADGGRNWDRQEAVEAPPEKTERLIPYGDIVRLPGHVLGVCIYSWLPSSVYSSCFYFSSDDGRTWQKRGVIQDGGMCETTPVMLPDGRLLAVARATPPGDQHLELFVSEDLGITWANQGTVTIGFQHPGHLLLLEDERLLLTYGIRNRGLYGIGARVSTDQGRTWQPPMVLVNLEGATDAGYPSSVQVEDGTLVTVYYCNGIPAHQRYHMGVIRWQTED